MGLLVSEGITYAEKAAHYQSMSVAMFKKINPDVKKIRSVKKQLQALLVATNDGGQVQFLPLLEKTGGPIADINKKTSGKPEVTLNQVNYDAAQGLIKLDLHVSGFPVLDNLKGAIEQKGLKVEIDRASEDEDRVKVKLKVKA